MSACSKCGSSFSDEEFSSCPTCASSAQLPDDQQSRILEASDPESDESVLGRYASSDDPEVVAAAVRNPSTPVWAKKRAARNPDPRVQAAMEEAGLTVEKLNPSEVFDRGPIQSSSKSLYRPNPRVTTLEYFPGYEIVELLGTVYATSSTLGLRAKDDKGSMINRLELRLEHATREALVQLWRKAQSMRADAVVGVKIAAAEAEGSGISNQRSTGTVVIGTAVRLTKKVD